MLNRRWNPDFSATAPAASAGAAGWLIVDDAGRGGPLTARTGG
ncbi:hypothetical protein [Nocardia rhamnosiphila]|uniref:Uncharacterized protein n=1 Tax=Nocardia rhamnosiphila TaxID=426716 RepID=A0ABV2X2P0_9NOCA